MRMVKTGDSIVTPALQLVTFTAMSAILFLVLFMRGDASVGDLVAYITAAGLLPKPIRQLSEVSSTIQKGLAGAESIFSQLDESPEVDAGTITRERVAGRIEIRNLSFRYPGTDRLVLDDVNISYRTWSNGRHCRPIWERQIDARQSAAALLPPRGRDTS
jgi:ATP-binding cassette, subfamily B, bacterial MsbA